MRISILAFCFLFSACNSGSKSDGKAETDDTSDGENDVGNWPADAAAPFEQSCADALSKQVDASAEQAKPLCACLRLEAEKRWSSADFLANTEERTKQLVSDGVVDNCGDQAGSENGWTATRLASAEANCRKTALSADAELTEVAAETRCQCFFADISAGWTYDAYSADETGVLDQLESDGKLAACRAKDGSSSDESSLPKCEGSKQADLFPSGHKDIPLGTSLAAFKELKDLKNLKESKEENWTSYVETLSSGEFSSIMYLFSLDEEAPQLRSTWFQIRDRGSITADELSERYGSRYSGGEIFDLWRKPLSDRILVEITLQRNSAPIPEVLVFDIFDKASVDGEKDGHTQGHETICNPE